jgi:hypothetical protein
MLGAYPAVPLSWTLEVADLTASEIAYGIDKGLIKVDVNLPRANYRAEPATSGKELISIRDVMFRLLLVNLYKHWFLCDRPLRALEFLVLDFEDCPSVDMDGGRLHSGVAGIAEGDHGPPELDREYFAMKARCFVSLTEHVLHIIQDGIRPHDS